MKQNLYFYGLVLLATIFLAHGLLTSTPWSLFTAACVGVLAVREKAGSKPGAPHAEADGIGSVHHQAVYIRAMNRCLDRIAATREMMRHDPAGAYGEWYRKYDNAKWTYALIYNRYEEAKKKYEWRY